jgi:hypothetical protein
MKTFKLDITETELDILRQSLSILKQTVIVDSDGIIKRKMPKEEDKAKYVNAIDNVYQRFLKIGFNE